MRLIHHRALHRLSIGVLFLAAITPCAGARSAKKSKDKEQTERTAYIAGLQRLDVASAPDRTVGSLWSPNDNSLADLSTDYKARKLNDIVVITVGVQTTAAQSGTLSSQRTFQTSSGITGLAGAINTTGLNPLFNANSSTALAGTGATGSNTTFATTMTGRVIDVLPSGNLVVEAHRNIFMNHQHEDVTVRGVVRPGDIGTNNTISSMQMSSLQITVAGKGIISDSTRPLNPVTKAILWLFGF